MVLSAAGTHLDSMRALAMLALTAAFEILSWDLLHQQAKPTMKVEKEQSLAAMRPTRAVEKEEQRLTTQCSQAACSPPAPAGR